MCYAARQAPPSKISNPALWTPVTADCEAAYHNTSNRRHFTFTPEVVDADSNCSLNGWTARSSERRSVRTMGIPPRTYGALQVKLRESLVARAVVLPIQQFIHIQGISSIFLFAAAVVALVWANSPWHDSYHHVWEMELQLSRLQLPIHAWINDALMAIFFFLVGMEIKHEIVHGELADMRRAALPVFGALGGMIVPALLYAVLNHRQPGQHGWGVPMATDIAFSLGVLGMVKGIPSDLKVFLLTLAIADDIGAIIVIAVFYSGSLDRGALLVGIVILALIALMLKLGISRPVVYFVLGISFWIAILRSGIHATIAGVILGFLVPTTAPLSLEDFQDMATDMARKFRDAMANGEERTAKSLLGRFDALLNNTESASERLTRLLNDWVSFLVLPLFALVQRWSDFFWRYMERVAHQSHRLGNCFGTCSRQAAGHRRLR